MNMNVVYIVLTFWVIYCLIQIRRYRAEQRKILASRARRVERIRTLREAGTLNVPHKTIKPN